MQKKLHKTTYLKRVEFFSHFCSFFVPFLLVAGICESAWVAATLQHAQRNFSEHSRNDCSLQSPKIAVSRFAASLKRRIESKAIWFESTFSIIESRSLEIESSDAAIFSEKRDWFGDLILTKDSDRDSPYWDRA